VNNTSCYYSSTGSYTNSLGTSTSFANFTSFAFVSGDSGLNWNESGNNITTADDSGFVWKMVESYTLPYFQYQDMPAPIPYVESISVNSGINNSAGSTSFLLNVTGCSFNTTGTVFVNLTMAGQTPINGTINSRTYTTINTTFDLTPAIAGNWSLYVINPDGQASIAKNFTISALIYSGGSGTLADPYLLSTDSDIDDLSATSADWGSNFTVTQNITLVGNHTPIGNSSINFTGNFNGSGFAIQNLTVYQAGGYAGFFGYAGSGANIHDIGVEISSDGAISTTGDYVGGLVGRNYGTVNNSYATGSVTGTVTGDYVGGLVGLNYGTVTNSYATGNVIGRARVGGLVGWNYGGTVTNSYATGDVTGSVNVVGGLVGSNDGTVANSYATGTVTATVTGDDYIGGLIGLNTGSGTVTNSYATGNVTGDQRVGGLVGSNDGTVTNSYATGNVTGDQRVGGLVGSNGGTGTVTNSYATGSATGSSYVGGLVGYNTGTVTDSCYYSSTGSYTSSRGTPTSYANFTSFAFVSGSSGLNWNESGNNITTADDSGFVWKMVESYTLPYFQYQDMPAPIPYVESISSSSGINNTDGSTSFWLNVTGCSFNITDTVFVNLTMAGQTPINGTIDSRTYTTINTIFDLTQAIAGDWSLYVINPDGQTSIAKTFTVQSLFIPGTPESFTNTTGNFWVNHSWNAGAGDVSDSYNVSYGGTWLNGTTDSFNHTGLSAHAWSNIMVYGYNATDSILSAGASDNVQFSNNDVSILNVTDITVYEGENVTFNINSTDADGDTPVFGCNNSALFDTFNTSTGEGSWVTDLSDAGTYYVEFNVSDGYGSVDSHVMNITINDVIIPVADINANTTMGPYPLSVQFTDNSSNIPTGWFWDFGDGTNSTLQNPATHTYNVAGIYNVSLNASNLAGSDLSSNMTITVTRPGTPESFTNTTGNFWVSHSWNAGTGDVSDSYNVSYNGTWLNGTTNSFNHTGLSAHAWSNITVYAYNATDSTLSAGASDNVQVSNNAVSILNVTDITIYEGENVTFNINSTDADGDIQVFGCNNSALFDTFNTSTGEGSWSTGLTDAGTYYVEFNVSDGYDSIDSQVMTITINDVIIPVANFSANVTSGAVPLSVNFTDSSTNTPTSWLWDFGDGSNSTDQNPAHTYVAAGTYNVSLNASNFAGSNVSTQLSYITAAVIPVANFSANVTSGAVPLSVNFTDSSTNTPTSWLWNFGDGSNSTDQNPAHTYVAAGTYNVSLNASNVGGSNVSTQLSYITAFVEPVANFSANTVTGYAPLAVSFTDNSSNIPTAWFWDFGDDTNSTQQNPTHTYSVTGIYNVSLNASNLAGSNLSSNMTITVTTAPSTDSSRSSSSGSRASVSQGQNQEIVSNSASSVIRVTGGSEVYYDFSDSGIPVIGVSFDAKDDEGLVVARVQVLSDVSEGVPAQSGNCYQVMSIDVGNEGTISSDNAENLRIHFKVSRQWIEENNIDVSTIRMTRYHNEHWNDLPTYQESEDDEYIYFYAETPGFSIFEVVGDQLGTPIETSQVPAGSPVPVEEEEMPVEEESGFGFIYLILGIAAITGIGYVLIQKHKGEGGL
jgi:PGF-pre-PGF domain-containing protein